MSTAYYASRREDPNLTRIHVGYESITDEDHTDSPHMRQRITGILQKRFPGTDVVCLSADTEEARRNCISKNVDIALISIHLPSTETLSLKRLVEVLQKANIKVVILYKVSEALPEDEQILTMEGVTTIRVKRFREDFTTFLETLA